MAEEMSCNVESSTVKETEVTVENSGGPASEYLTLRGTLFATPPTLGVVTFWPVGQRYAAECQS